MTFRQAERTLTGRIMRADWDADVRYGSHEIGRPAVTVDLRGTNGTRTYDDPDELFRLADDLASAAAWLKQQHRALHATGL